MTDAASPCPSPAASPEAIAAFLRGLDPAYAPTPLCTLPALARRLGVAQVLAKDESGRRLGSFKSLGGTYAGLMALARAAGTSPADLLAARPAGQPALVCASDGNHGLAVAAAARFAGAPARVFLHAGVPPWRERRILGEGAEIVRIAGTYDDAVEAAAASSRDSAGLLIADTTDDPNDPVVRDVMAGYGVMAAEIRDQAEDRDRPTCSSRPASGGSPPRWPRAWPTGSAPRASSWRWSPSRRPASPRHWPPAARSGCRAISTPPPRCCPAARPAPRPSRSWRATAPGSRPRPRPS